MNRKDFYFRQPLKENELDDAFTAVENSEWNIVKDLGLTGIASGGGVVPDGSTPTCSVADFRAYDKLGRRLAWTVASVDFTNDTAGTPTIPAAGQFRYITLVARFGRSLSDGRTDGNSDPIDYQQDETISATG